MGKKDITQKAFFEDAERFADLINAAYFGGAEVLSAEELKIADGGVRAAEKCMTQERIRDVVKMQTKDGCVYAVYVLENQMKVDYSMPIRVMLAESMEYQQQVRKIQKRNKIEDENALKSDEFICGFRKNNRLHPVYTLVLYWGDKEWDAAQSLREMIEIPDSVKAAELLREMIPNYGIHVYDLNKVKDFSNFKTTLRIIFEFYSHREEMEELKHYLNTHEDEVNRLDEEERFLLATILKENRLINRWLNRKEDEKEEKNVCKAIDDMIEEGKAEGKAESIIVFLGRFGKISESTVNRIKKETDKEVLNKWLFLTTSINSIEEFEAAM